MIFFILPDNINKITSEFKYRILKIEIPYAKKEVKQNKDRNTQLTVSVNIIK